MPELTSYAPGTPCWIDLSTTDPEAARSFYGPLMGWEFDVGGEETGGYTMCKLHGLDAAGIGQTMRPEQPVAWTTYFATADIAQGVEKIAQAGGMVVMPPMDVMTFGKMAVAVDPTGAAFALWEAVDHIGSQVVNEAGALVWNDLATPDKAAAGRFYTEVVGLEVAEMGEDLVGSIGGRPVVSFSEGTDQPGWRVHFNVPDTDALVEKARQAGGTVAMEPAESPYGRMAGITDPQGATFYFIDGDPEADPGADGA